MAEAAHSDGIGSFVIEARQPLNLDAFSRAMDTLIALRGPDLLRVKGFLNVEGCQGPGAGAIRPASRASAGRAGSNGRTPTAHSRLVFITRNLPEAKVRALFAAVEGLA